MFFDVVCCYGWKELCFDGSSYEFIHAISPIAGTVDAGASRKRNRYTVSYVEETKPLF